MIDIDELLKDKNKQGAVYDDEGNIVDVTVDCASGTDHSAVTVIDMKTGDPVEIEISEHLLKDHTKALIEELSKYKAPENETKINGWVARDKNGELYFHERKPVRVTFLSGWDSPKFFEIDRDLFPDLKWKNNPMRVACVFIPVNETE
jgi:hypothetical protein